MEERRNLLNKMKSDAAKKWCISIASGYRVKKEALKVQVDTIKEVLFATKKTGQQVQLMYRKTG